MSRRAAGQDAGNIFYCGLVWGADDMNSVDRQVICVLAASPYKKIRHGAVEVKRERRVAGVAVSLSL